MTPVREGDLLAGKYRIERVLGVGGMGVVVAARHEQLDQLVAIKFVREDALGNEDAIERFLREARSAVRLKSDHVARVIDVGKLDSGAPYMVMEFLDGDDLARVLETRGPMAPDAAVQLVLQACDAVAEAHAAGIVHRDLKPENLFLTQTVAGRPKLKVLDFGVSKSSGMTTGGQGALTRTRSMLGSPLYMSPEHMPSAKDVDARADVWALGVVLFQLLTCRWPFEAQNMPELCLKVVTEPPQSIASLRPELAPGLVAVIERCLEKDPAGRYADAAALAQALEPFAPELAPRRSPSSASLAGPEERPALVPQSSTLVSPRISSQLTPAPSAWDSMSGRTGASSAAVSRSRSFLWIGALAAVLIVALALVFSRRGPTSAAASSLDITAQSSATPPRADVPAVTATLAPTAAPEPTATPAPAEAPAPALTPAEPTTLSRAAAADAGAAKLATPLAHPAKLPPRPAGQPRPTKTDDDIPALR
jgi:serine/threonine-protein kinase